MLTIFAVLRPSAADRLSATIPAAGVLLATPLVRQHADGCAPGRATHVMQAAVFPRILCLPGLEAVRHHASVWLAVCVRLNVDHAPGILVGLEDTPLHAVPLFALLVLPSGETVKVGAGVAVVWAEAVVPPFGFPATVFPAEIMDLAVFPPGSEISGLVAGGELAVVIDAEPERASLLVVQRRVRAAVVLALVSSAAAPSGLAVGPRLVAAVDGAAVVGAEDGLCLAASNCRSASTSLQPGL